MKKITVTATTLALALSTAVPAAGQAESKRLEKGLELLSQRRYDRAIRELEKANKAAGGASASALLGLAQAHLRLGHYPRAEATARSLLEVSQDPGKRGQAYSLLGVALYQQDLDASFPKPVDGDAAPPSETLREAARSLERAIEIRGDEATVDRYNLAEVLVQLGRDEEATVLLDRYLDLVGDDDELLGPRELRCWLEAKAVAGETEEGAAPELTPPRKVQTAAPQYTPLARRYKIQGTVLLQAVIDEAGNVRCARPLRGLPLGLTESAMRAAKSWKFEPALKDGKPTRVFYTIMVGFAQR